MRFKALNILKGRDMSKNFKDSEKGNLSIEDYRAFRRGEKHDTSHMTSSDSQAIEEVEQISKLFRDVKPNRSDILESIDHVVLSHIRQKSREIRRERKLVPLFSRYKWAAAGVMTVLVSVASFHLVLKMEKPTEDFLKDNATQILEEKTKIIPAQIAKDIDGNGRVNIIDAYIMDRRLMSGVAMPKKMDLNGDGNIDHEDINTIVKTAVSSGRGEV